MDGLFMIVLAVILFSFVFQPAPPEAVYLVHQPVTKTVIAVYEKEADAKKAYPDATLERIPYTAHR